MEFLPKDIVAALRAAYRPEGGRKSRLRIHTGDKVLPVLRRWRGGFALDAARVSQLRGHVEIYEGGRHIASALIVASDIDGDELICTVKRETPVADRAPLDFVRDEGAPVGLIEYRQ